MRVPFRPALIVALALALAALPALVRAEAPATAPATRPVAEQVEAQAAEHKFLKFAPDGKGGGALETAIAHYENAAGIRVDLIGAVHIADPAYYKKLGERFDGYDAVLYELVSPPKGQTRQEALDEHPVMGLIGTLQQAMKNALGLSFQLQAIDYKRKNFVHADMDLDTFTKMQADRGEGFLEMLLQSMLTQMNQPESENAPTMVDLVDALNSPDPQRAFKLILAKQFQDVDKIMAAMEGPNGSVILTERNKVALGVLKDELKDPTKRKIGIFFGAAHLKGMEKILTTEMGFHPIGQPDWLVAWDLTSK